MSKKEETKTANNNRITWIEKERSIKIIKEEILKSRKYKHPVDGLAFSDLNQIWKVQKEIVDILDNHVKTNRSLGVINSFVFRVYSWVLQAINHIPYITLFGIGYGVIVNFSLWNLFVGLFWQIVIATLVKIFTWIIIVFVGYGAEKVQDKKRRLNGILKVREVGTDEITPDSGFIETKTKLSFTWKFKES